MNVGIALSGGGIRGIAHAGILQALEERGVKISVVSGTSAGALIGALYCAGFSPKEILEIGKENSLISLVKPVLPSKGLATLGNIVKSFSELIPHNSFENLNLPFYVSLTNMYKGQAEYFSHGDLFKIVEASCSIPIIFKPVEINGIEYSDGGVMNNLPTEILRDKCDFLIGANLVVNPDIGQKSMNSLIKVAKRTFELQAFSNSLKSLEICDLIIMPKRLKSVGTFQAKSLDLVYEFGYKAAIDVLDAHSEIIKNIVDAQ